jgi:putative ABC transport system ATP-binding protein
MALIEIKNLTKTYGKDEATVHALNNVSLKIEQGQVIAIVGPSGSGKSTLLHMIGGVDKPTLGEIYFDGKNIVNLNEKELAIYRRRKIGFVFQAFNLIPVLSVEENIAMPMLLDNKGEDQDSIDEVIAHLGLTSKKNNLPSELSGGQQQRVAIGRALCYKPSVVLADEPTGNLDSKSSDEIIELLKVSNKKYKQTVIIITHNEDIALEADRIITIDDGKIVSDEKVKHEYID